MAPRAILVSTPDEAGEAALSLGCPVVVKAQVLIGGRGKAGGVRKADSPADAIVAARDIFSRPIQDLPVRRLLVAEALDIDKEFYCAVLVDRAGKCVRCILSASGGVDIETVARATPEKIVTRALPPFSRKQPFDQAQLMALFGTEGLAHQAGAVLDSMLELFFEKNCTLVEVNPLILTKGNVLVAADAKIVLDENGLFKNPELEKLRNSEEFSAEELSARGAGLSFVGLNGRIGCMVNGAGLAMTTMDLIHIFGGSPANFLDVGGSSNPQKVVDALRIILTNPSVSIVLINIFGGITRCDDIARGILLARQKLAIKAPLVVRLTGTNQDEGRVLLSDAGISAYTDMVAAIRRAVDLERAAP